MPAPWASISATGTSKVDGRDPAGASPGPGHAAPLCGPQPDLREPAPASEGRIRDTPRGHRACAYGSCHHKTSRWAFGGDPPGGCRAPRGRQNPSTSVCPHTWDSLLAFDMHCQILNFTIHSTFQLSTHRKRRTFVEGLPLNTSEIPPNARVSPPTPRPVQSLGCPVFGKPTGILQPKRKTPWKTPTSHLSASLLRCFLGSVVTVVVFFPLSISLSQGNAFLMRKFMKSIRFAENGNARPLHWLDEHAGYPVASVLRPAPG